MTEIRRVALDRRRRDRQRLGGAPAGAWFDVVASDPGPDAESENARQLSPMPGRHCRSVGLNPAADKRRLRFVQEIETAVAEADFVQENAPEREDLKRKLHARIDAAAPSRCDHRVQLLRPAAEPNSGRLQTSRTHRYRPSVQPGLSASAGRGAGRREDERRQRSTAPPRFTRPSACGR